MVNVCFAGITGWAASAIVAAIDDANDLTLTSGVSRSAAGQSLATAAGSASPGSVYATMSEALESAGVDVLVDFTSAVAVKDNVWTAVQAGVHVVIGSSGLTSRTMRSWTEPAVTVALSELHGPVEARGAEVAGVRIHSVRLPSFVVTTEVVFGGPGERLVMRHDPEMTPAPYVPGTLLAVRKVADVAGVRRGLDSLLFAEPAPDRGP